MASPINSNGSTSPEVKSTLASAQDQASALMAGARDNTAAAGESIRKSSVVQDLTNGPAGTSIKNQTQAMATDLDRLAGARQPPSQTAANDTSLTQYHSFFRTLLSWEHPRATALTFASSLVFILACRYLPVVRWALKLTWTILGFVTLAEGSANLALGSSVAGSVRPRRYYRIPKQVLEATLDDVEQLINFFVIEVQRIIFAENVPVTALAFATSFVSYYLIKLLPAWGMALLSTCVIFLVPLIYKQNKELIDAQLRHASDVIGEQTAQIKDITAQQTSRGLESVKAYTGDYASKATEYMGKSRQKIPMVSGAGSTGSTVKSEDFPAAPQSDLDRPSAVHAQPELVATN